MAMFVNWYDLQTGGRDRHGALLAEATRYRLVRQVNRKETTVQDNAEQSHSIAPTQELSAEELRQRGKFTAREWRRLVFLQWLYRHGHLTD